MPDKLFIVKVRTSGLDDDDLNLTDHFAKTLAVSLARTAYRVIDVQEAVFAPTEKSSKKLVAELDNATSLA